MNTKTAVLGAADISFKEKPFFGIIREIPKEFAGQFEGAVKDFMNTSHLPEGINRDGFFNQTLASIANSTYLHGNGELWTSIHQGKVLNYALATVTQDIDGRLAYHVYQAWVSKEYRGSPLVKEWWGQIRARAKGLFCKHLIISSSRGSEVYKRFLGSGMYEHAVLLKETI